MAGSSAEYSAGSSMPHKATPAKRRTLCGSRYWLATNGFIIRAQGVKSTSGICCNRMWHQVDTPPLKCG